MQSNLQELLDAMCEHGDIDTDQYKELCTELQTAMNINKLQIKIDEIVTKSLKQHGEITPINFEEINKEIKKHYEQQQYSTEEIEEHIGFLTHTLIPDLKESGTTATAENFEKCCQMLQQLLEGKMDLIQEVNRRKEPIIIEYYTKQTYNNTYDYTKQTYNNTYEYIKDQRQKELIEKLIGRKTINSYYRNILSDLTNQTIIWKLVHTP